MFIFVAAAGISTYLTIHLLIRSEDTVVVPSLAGKEVVYALELLSDLELNIKVKGLKYNAQIPKNHVISQEPEAGSEIKKGRDVRLIISKGAQAVAFPNVKGVSLPQARIVLAENDLGVGPISYTFDLERPKDDILCQYPLAGAVGLRKTLVSLLVSAGPRPQILSMSDLEGLSLAQAVEAIEKQGLTTGAIRTIQDPSHPSGLVMAQIPQSGTPVAAGNSVDLTVNQIEKRDHQFRSEGATLFRYRADRGFLKQKIHVRLNRPTTSIELFDAFVKPGREIWLSIPHDKPATLMLYIDDELAKTEHYD